MIVSLVNTDRQFPWESWEFSYSRVQTRQQERGNMGTGIYWSPQYYVH